MIMMAITKVARIATALVAALTTASITSCADQQAPSGVYGWIGSQLGGSGIRRSIDGPAPLECVQILDPANWTLVARGTCKQGFYEVSLAPGRYIFVSPRGAEAVTVAPNRWLERDVLLR